MSNVVALPFTLGDAIRRARIDAKMSMEEVAIAVGVRYKTVWNWEHDIFAPRGRNLSRLIEVTGAAWLPHAAVTLRCDSRCYPKCADQELSPVAA